MRRATARHPSPMSVPLPGPPSSFHQGEDTMKTAHACGCRSLGPLIRIVGATLASATECPACLHLPLFCPHSPAHTQLLSLRDKLLPAPRQYPWPDLTSPPERAFHQQPLCHQPQAGKEPRILWDGQPLGLLPQWPTETQSRPWPWPWPP